MNPIGITTWIWTSPLSIDKLKEIAPHVKTMGFDLLEIPIESPTDLDYAAAAPVIKDLGLQTSVCAAMSPDRDLIHADESIRRNVMTYVRHCVDAARTRWSEAKAQGFDVTYWQPDEQGRWVKKA